jgi:rRNA maturation endonuclease Nob1
MQAPVQSTTVRKPRTKKVKKTTNPMHSRHSWRYRFSGVMRHWFCKKCGAPFGTLARCK